MVIAGSLLEGGVETVLFDDPHALGGHFEGDETLLALRPETLGLEVEGEVALGAQLGMGNVVADHSLPSSNLTNL